jgi:hypothetical protein
MSARRRPKVTALPTPPARASEPYINHDLLTAARKDAFVLLLAPDGILFGAGTYTHEETEIQDGAVADLALALSTKLATIGRQAAGEAAPC